MNSDQGTELRSGRIISSSLETPVPTDPDMAQSSGNDSDNNETSDISSQLSEIRESYERKINELQNEFSQLKDLMMAVISKTDSENRPSTSKGPSKPTHTVGLDRDPLVSPGMVWYAGKQEKPFWFSSLDQIVHFGPIIFCKNYFGQFVWIEKKSHYNSRVSLHEAPTKNDKLVFRISSNQLSAV